MLDHVIDIVGVCAPNNGLALKNHLKQPIEFLQLDKFVESEHILANCINSERLTRRIQDYRRDQRSTNSELVAHYALKAKLLGSMGTSQEEETPPPVPDTINDTMMLLVYLGLKLSYRLCEQATLRITSLCEILSEGYQFERAYFEIITQFINCKKEKLAALKLQLRDATSEEDRVAA